MASSEVDNPSPLDGFLSEDLINEEQTYGEQLGIVAEKFKQQPELIAHFLEATHENSPARGRAFLCQVYEKILIFPDEVPDATFRVVCTTGLLDVLIDIALDARIYMWNKPASSFYDPYLGVSLVPTVFFIS